MPKVEELISVCENPDRVIAKTKCRKIFFYINPGFKFSKIIKPA
jgi:hypothetical protein